MYVCLAVKRLMIQIACDFVYVTYVTYRFVKNLKQFGEHVLAIFANIVLI